MPDPQEQITDLSRRAEALYRQGRMMPALELARQAFVLAQRSLHHDHPLYAASLNNLAALYFSIGDYAQVEPLFQQALEICRRALGENNPFYASSLSNLAALYKSMGDYAQAEPRFQQALQTRRRVLGEDHPDYAASLNNLAELYRSMGDYAQAEPLYQQVLEISRRVRGEDHPDYATGLNNLALLCHSMGDYAQAERLFKQAMEIKRRVLGEDHPNYANTLNNLAGLYESMGDYAQAEPLHRKALEIRRRVLGEDHPDYAASLSNLALLYESMGDYARAEPRYQQALEIMRHVLGEDHPDVATGLNNLAVLYRSMGDYVQAEPLYQQALEITRRVQGEDHPNFAASLNNLGVLCAATTRTPEALARFEEASAIEDRMIGQLFSFGSERQRTAYLDSIAPSLHAFLSLVLQQLSGSLPAVRSALDLVLRRKAVGAEVLAAQRDAVHAGRNPQLKPKLAELAALHAQIGKRTMAGPGPEGLSEHQRLLADWNDRKERLESELARQIPEMNLQLQLQAADRRAVALGLPEGAALIEFARFPVYDFSAVLAPGERRWKPARYAAFVMSAGDPDDVRMVDLGEAEPIDAMIAAFRDGIIQDGSKHNIDMTPATRRAPENDGDALRKRVFDPLVSAMKGRTRLFLSPDGDLTRLPFEVLPTANDRQLIDDYQVSYVSTGRDVVRFGAATSGDSAESVVVADPDFDLNADRPALALEDGVEPNRSVGRLSREMNRDGQVHFSALPGTALEGEQIAGILAVQELLMGDAALKYTVKYVRSPRILHIATHGFFLQNREHDPNAEREVGFRSIRTDDESGALSVAGIENPLLRSGLALAGVNTWFQNGAVPKEAEDGVLTAMDVTGMDLLDTELVVLSACETGLGDVRVGEGVMGLRRAFVLAGAKTLVMSLWKVPDLTTLIMIWRFYDNLTERSLPRDQSLREAQCYVRDLTIGRIRDPWLTAGMIERLAGGNREALAWLQALAAEGDDHRPFELPYYWGAFICQGDPSALPS